MKYKSNILFCLDISYSIVYQVLNINQSISNVTDEGMKGRTKSEAGILRGSPNYLEYFGSRNNDTHAG